jgi:hypothetical protein
VKIFETRPLAPVAELAAGSPVVEPRPPGALLCVSAAANTIAVSFMAVPFG